MDNVLAKMREVAAGGRTPYVQINISVVQRQNATAIPQTCTVVTALKSAIASDMAKRHRPWALAVPRLPHFCATRGCPLPCGACLENTCHQPDERSSITATIKDAQVFAHIL